LAGLGAQVKTEFDIRSRMNGFTTINGEDVQLWYFDIDGSNSGFMSDRVLPSAHFETIEGQLTKLNFFNAAPMPHTIHLHGLDVDQQNDGVPATSFTVPSFESYTYEFIAPHAGTYHYHCHVDTVVHYQRGMAGAVIVRPPDGSTNKAWEGGPVFDEEVLWQLVTFDTTWKNLMVSGPATARHRPDVFMLNGKQTAEATLDPFTRVELSVGEIAYIRVVNSAYQWGRVSLGGLPFQVVASDGRPMRQVPTAVSWELGPGERYDLMLVAESAQSVAATIDYLDDYTGNALGQVATEINIV
jgi:FtsP/CotA-like multicopper oxidase with cupredoxin domain